jgi:hypothetical protein
MCAATYKVRAAAIVVAVHSFIGITAAVCQAMEEDVSKPTWGEEKAGFVCSISAGKTTYQPGEPIPVRFDLKNVSDQPITVWHCGFWPNHRWIVEDAAGREPPLTEHGRLCRDRYGPDTPRRKNAPFVVQPGKMDAFYGPYDLRRHFEIPDGATIHVRCVYLHIAKGKSVELTSNTLTLKMSAHSR